MAEIEHHAAAIEAATLDAVDQAGAVFLEQVAAIAGRPMAVEGGCAGPAGQAGFDGLLLVRGQLGAGGAEHLDAVVPGGVVTG